MGAQRGRPRKRRLSAAHKAKIGATLRGRKRPPETIAKMSAAAMGNKSSVGRKLSKRTRELIGAAQKGNRYSVGIKRSAEYKAEQAKRMRGNKYKLGKKDSPETRARKAVYQLRRSGVPVLRSPAPGVMGFTPRYDVDRIVFYCP